MPIIKRVFFIPCRGDECLKLAELIKDNITTLEAAIEVKEHGIEVTLYGYKTDIKRAWVKVKQIVSLHKELSSLSGKEHKRIPVDYLVSLTRKTFPPILLVEILSRKGYKAKYSNGVIETNADIEFLKNVIEKIAEVYEEIKYSVRGTTTKYFVAAASIILDLDPNYVIEEGLKKGLLRSDEEEKPRLTKEWRQALKEFMESISSEIPGDLEENP
ncbi:DUF2067 family protein [Desulfurococcaceae archaeon MEX13E-LK6-19]|nr:DUF2067 family protein [Desulfurococcaceae archaeon MEX13E-LK6-19]